MFSSIIHEGQRLPDAGYIPKNMSYVFGVKKAQYTVSGSGMMNNAIYDPSVLYKIETPKLILQFACHLR